MYKSFHCKVETLILQMFKRISEVSQRDTHASHSLEFDQPKPKLELSRRSFNYHGTRIWKIPDIIKLVTECEYSQEVD